MASTIAMKSSAAVRIEDDTSIGRSYTSTAIKSTTIAGIGAQRRSLRTKSFNPYANGKQPVLESCTMAKVNLNKATREEVMEYFHNTWDLTETLFAALRDDSVFYMTPDKLRRPLIFYFAHPATLYVNKMHQAGVVDNINPYFQKLFETGVDEMSWDDMDAMQDEDFAWPDVKDAMEFREKIKTMVEGVITNMPHPRDVPVTMESPLWSLFMGFEHERIHLETSSVLIHQLPIDCVVQPEGWRIGPSFAPEPSAVPVNSVVDVPAGKVVLGKPTSFPSFGWDNEYGAREVDVPSFEAAKFLVTNGEFLPFVLAGGYKNKQWWIAPNGDDEGWRWAAYRNATHPSFWVATSHPDMLQYHGGKPGHPYQKDDGHALAGTGNQFKLRTIFSIIDMPWDWPAEVNYLEAAAWMRWKASQEGPGVTYRFPTEAEYHMIRGDPVPYKAATVGTERPDRVAGDGFGDGKLGPEGNGKTVPVHKPDVDEDGRVDIMLQPTAPGNINMRWHSSTPVDMYGPSSTGFHDPHGNVYQWVEDHFAPLPGFEIHYMYDDFSSPCFDGWHTVIMGGSWVSTGDQASSFARYHFRRHFFQHLGFRYVRLSSACAPEPYPGSATVTNLWEGMSTVSKDITDAYGRPTDRLQHPPELVSAPNAMAYNINLAHLAAKAYEAHVVASTPSAAPAASASVLHIGCGVGGATFELARVFGRVVGIDNREPAIRHARVFQHHGQFEYERVREGVLTDTALVRVPQGVDRSRVSFVVGDAGALGEEVAAGNLGPFDVVILDSLLTRLRQPLDVLKSIHALVNPGGLLIITSNNDWNPGFTPRNSWMGGFKMNGEDQSTLTMLRYTLKRQFAYKEACDIARLSRQHARRYVLDVLETSVWRRNAE